MAYSLAGFNGQRPDPVSGHYHLGNGYRAYSPVLGRFTSPDDMSPFGPGGVNPYAYCAGDPVNRADPSGHFSLGQGIGMVLGFVAGIALGILTEGAAMPAVLTLMATVAGEAAIGAGTELATEAIDGQRVNWGQVGIWAAIALVGYGVGRLSKLKGVSNQPFGGFMMASSATSSNQSVTDSFRILGITHAEFADGSDHTFTDLIYAYSDISRGKNRLNIFVHGQTDETQRVYWLKGNQRQNAEDLAELVHRNYTRQELESFRAVCLRMCHSAESDFSRQFARHLNLPQQINFTGYTGTTTGAYENTWKFLFKGNHTQDMLNLRRSAAQRIAAGMSCSDAAGWLQSNNFTVKIYRPFPWFMKNQDMFTWPGAVS